MADAMQYFLLNNGVKIPSLALGTGDSDPGVVGQAIETTIKIGEGLKRLLKDGVVKRGDLFITSKLWCTDNAPEDVTVAFNKTLDDLQLDYIDLYLIHWPVLMKNAADSFKPENLIKADIPSTWQAMEKLYDSGRANFSIKKLGDLLEVARIPPAVNRVECHPTWQKRKLQEFCESKGVHHSGYSPLSSTGLKFLTGDEVLKQPVVLLVAEKLGKTSAQVCLRWGVQIGHSVLPKSTNESRIKENFDVVNWFIPDDLLTKFSEIQQASMFRASPFAESFTEIFNGEL